MTTKSGIHVDDKAKESEPAVSAMWKWLPFWTSIYVPISGCFLAYSLYTTINLCGKTLCHHGGKGHSIQICNLILTGSHPVDRKSHFGYNRCPFCGGFLNLTKNIAKNEYLSENRKSFYIHFFGKTKDNIIEISLISSIMHCIDVWFLAL